MFSHEACLGVWVTAKRGWAASQARVALEVWEEPLSMTRWIFKAGSVHWLSRRRKLMNAWELLRSMRWAMTWPVATSMAAMMETVPWRRYSNSRRSTWPGWVRIVGWRRDLAWMPVFSSTLTSSVSGERSRYRRHTCPAWAQKAGLSVRLSQPRTLCGRTLASARTRPTVEADSTRPRSARCAAIEARVQTLAPSGGAEVATATTA